MKIALEKWPQEFTVAINAFRTIHLDGESLKRVQRHSPRLSKEIQSRSSGVGAKGTERVSEDPCERLGKR